MQLLTIVAMLFTALAVVFAVQNNTPVTLTFLTWQFEGSLALILLLALASGGIIVALVSTPATLRRQWANRRLRKQVAALEKVCAAQNDTIADMEDHLSESKESSITRAPYVGLKQLIFEGGGREEKGGTPPI